MPWVRFDDQFPLHRKVKGLSDGAFRLHTETIFWCARNMTDGFVPAEDIPSITAVRRPHKFIPELVRRGGWVERADGWQIHDYLDWQPSRAKIEHKQETKANRQSRWLARRKGKDRDASIDASQDATQDVSPTRALHAPPPTEGGASAGASARAREAARSHPQLGETSVSSEARHRAEIRAKAIAACDLCDETGYAQGKVCDHDPDATDRAARGVAAARAAMQRKESA